MLSRTSTFFAAAIIMSVSSLFAQSPASGIVINEIYIGTVRNILTNDSYVELYNPTSKTVYLDGCLLVLFGASGGSSSGGALQGPVEAWKFPGAPGEKTLAVAPEQFVFVAANAANASGGLDLSAADYETYAGIPFVEPDNASAKNLKKLGAGQITSDLALSQTHDAIVLADGTDTVMSDGLLETTVLDGVQYSTAAGTGNLPAAIDAGMTGGSGLKLGVSMERTQAGVTTHNSSVDFALVPKASPGYEHGTEPGTLPKAIELFPLDLGKYVEYDEYTTDTLGLIDTSFAKTGGSTVVWRENLTFGGYNNAAWIKDTTNIIGSQPGIENNLHYRANGKGDVDAFADQNFASMFVPSAFASALTTPDSFVNYLNLSAGFKKSYPIVHLNQDITISSYTVNIDIIASGSFQGIDSVTVPGGSFDSSYIFAIRGDVAITLSGLPLASFSPTQKLWLVKGIGVVKTNSAAVNTQFAALPGSERQMKGHGTRLINAVRESNASTSSIHVNPNPLNDHFMVSSDGKGIEKIVLTDITGCEVMTLYNGLPQSRIELSRPPVSQGTYFLMVSSGGSTKAEKIVIE